MFNNELYIIIITYTSCHCDGQNIESVNGVLFVITR